MNIKLGRKPTRIDNGGPGGASRTLKLATYSTALPSPPASVDWYSSIPTWPLLGNDRVGNCFFTMIAHMAQSWTRLSHGIADMIPRWAVIRAYSKATGYNPARPWTDVGVDMLTGMNYWRRRGVGGHRIKAFAQVEVDNPTEIKQGIALFGGVAAGIAMPTAIQSRLTPGSIWDAPAGPLTGDWEPWSWGGHAVPLLGYYNDGLYHLVSWNAIYHATPAFIAAYLEECYVGYSVRDWTNHGIAPNGVLAQTLLSDVAAIAA